MAPYLLLASAVFFEVIWTVALRASKNFTVLWASLVMAVAYVLSLVCLNFTCQRFNASTAYAVWTGTGTALVAVLGVLLFDDRINAGRILGFALLICGAVVLLALENPA